ncbi:MAG TPA: hypothetical protein VFL90_22305 [Methylomirabilota bacterium]|nr:hypothetical protein [Methylomirabilota bacterium]
MARFGRFFVHEVNVTIVAVVTLAAVAGAVHYVSLLREVHQAREELCAARLDALAGRHPYLRATGDLSDKCTALGTLVGEAPPPPRPWRARLNL